MFKDIDIYLRDGPFESDIEIVNLHPTKGTHWVAYIKKFFFVSFGGSSQKLKLSRFIIKRNGYCLNSEYKVQVLDSY